MNHCEKEWLKYARNVLTSDSGPETCCLDSAPNGHVKRWPGYLGKKYATGRVLLVGEVHNGDEDSPASLFKAKEILDLEKVAREWASLAKPTAKDNRR